MSLRNFFISEDSQGDNLVISPGSQQAGTDQGKEDTKEDPSNEPDPVESDDKKPTEENQTEEGDETPSASVVQALESRAKTAEAQVTQLTAQVAQLTADRDRYKAWYEKQAGLGKQLPQSDASDLQTSGYNSHALDVFRKAH